MIIKIVDPLTDSRWDGFVEAHPAGTIFHHSMWSKVLRDRYQCDPTCYIEENEKGEIQAGIPFFRIKNHLTGKRLVCIPGSEYCFPLGYSADSITRLMTAAEDDVRSKQASFLEIRGWAGPADPEELGLCVSSTYLTHVTDLAGDSKKLRSTFDKEYHFRRNLKRAEKSGLTIREAGGENDLREFHKLTIETRRRLCLLPWPYRFIADIYRHLVLSGRGSLLLAEYGGRIVAGNMYLIFKDRVLLKFSASSKTYSDLRPNYLLTWKAIERYCNEGYKRYDFGITDSDNSGLLSFKRQWTNAEIPLHYYVYPPRLSQKSLRKNDFVFGAYRTFNRLLPDAVLRAAARVVHRRLG